MRKILRISFFLLSLSAIVGCVNFFKLSDLRTEGYSYPNNTDKARQLLADMGQAHRIDLWDNLETYRVTFGDEFYGFMGKQAHPFKEQNMEFELTYIPKTFTGQMVTLNGKEKDKIRGIQSWQTYEKDADGNITVKKDKDYTFWIPTYQYFIELPNRIQEATTVDYLGRKVINGIESEGVIASWNTVSPQKEIDQYIIWIDAASKRIVKVDYTVRDAYKFVTGGAYYKDYKEYNGLLLPTNMPVESNLLKEGFLHRMSIKDFTPNPVEAASLMPL